MLGGLRCDFCDKDALAYNEVETAKAYLMPESLTLFNIDDKIIQEVIDKSITRYLVFTCNSCRASVKLTFRDIEKKIRKNIYEKVSATIVARGLRESDAINFVEKTLIYCGKCNGFDGNGSCPIKIFKECKLKRLPYEL